MEIAKIQVSGTKANVLEKKVIPTGLVGGYITVEYLDSCWDGLTKTVVFRCGNVTKDVVTGDTKVLIPSEIVEHTGEKLYVGFYGTRADQTMAVPTLWENVGPVKYAADPSGDETTNPSLPVWAQLVEEIEVLKQGSTDGGSGKDGGYYTPAVAQPDANQVEFSFAASRDDMPAVESARVELPGKDAVLYTAQELTEGQKVQVRENIGAASASDVDKFNLLLEEAETSKNILPPDSESGYYDSTNNAAPLAGEKHIRTPSMISVEKGSSKYIYVTTNGFNNTSVVVNLIFFDAEGTQTASVNYRSDTFGGKGGIMLNGERVKILVSVLNAATVGCTMEDICVYYEDAENHDFEAYAVPGKKVVKTDALNKAAIKMIAPLYGKTIVNFGDSVFGKHRPPEDISTELAKLTGATVYNCGFGGCRMSQHSMSNFDAFSMYRLADAIVSGDWTAQDSAIADTTQTEILPSYFSEALGILKSLDFSKVDIVTIAYGANDFTAGIHLENPDIANDTSTFAGALRYSIEKLLTAYPRLKICVCSQTYRFYMDSDNQFVEDSTTKTNSNGVKLTEFVEKTQEVANAYLLPYLDHYYGLGINKFNRTQYFLETDGTHPNAEGCRLIAAHMAKALF